MSYYPKRPVKSFQDLEVYQKALAICVAVVKRIAVKTPRGWAKYSPEVEEITTRLHQCVLSLPVLIATAHSIRFSNQAGAITKLEEAMLNCNLAVVSLEQYRDIYNASPDTSDGSRQAGSAHHNSSEVEVIEYDFFDEQIKNLLTTRMKIMHLQRSWKKFFENKNHEKK
jgi:hypothetical protein